jgi:hypothetical protein
MLIDRSLLIAGTLLLALISTCALVLGYLRDRRAGLETVEQQQQRAATGAHTIATQRLVQSLGALRRRPQRLAILADAANEAAAASRQCAGFGLAPCRQDMTTWTGPEGPQHSSLRPGNPKRWQAVDRAISHLLATADDPTLGFDAQADAYQQLADAARALAADVSETPRPHGREECWFCGQSAKQVHRLIAGKHASICNECVELCNEVLE